MFRRLGYAVDGDGTRFRAKRKWRTVDVTSLCADDAKRPGVVVGGADGDELRCFVTWKECVDDLTAYLRELAPDYEWAVIGVDGSEEFDVVRDRDRDLVVA